MTTLFLPEDVAKDEGYAKALPDGRCMSYPDPLSPFAIALRRPLAERPAGWQTFSPEPWSIGFGTTGPDVNRSTVWTQAQAYARMMMRLGEIQRDLTTRAPWWRSLCDSRQDVCANISYNAGVTGFLKFKRAIAAMQLQDWKVAQDEILDSDAARDLPIRYHRLAQQMHDGVRIPA